LGACIARPGYAIDVPDDLHRFLRRQGWIE